MAEEQKSSWWMMILAMSIVAICLSFLAMEERATRRQQADVKTMSIDAVDVMVIDTWPDDLRLPVDLARVVDGDTMVCDIRMPWDVTMRGQIIRAYGYDTWECRRVRRAGTDHITEDEIKRGVLAVAAFEELLRKSDGIFVTPASQPRDSFGRILAIISVRQNGKYIDVAKYMKDRGHDRNGK